MERLYFNFKTKLCVICRKLNYHTNKPEEYVTRKNLDQFIEFEVNKGPVNPELAQQIMNTYRNSDGKKISGSTKSMVRTSIAPSAFISCAFNEESKVQARESKLGMEDQLN